jgi:tRNA (cytidine/uridine-2'-O-)-methyltransferase
MLTLKTEISSLPNGNGYEPTTQPGWGAVGGPDSASPRSCKCQNAVQMPVLCDEAVRDYRRRMRICLFEPEIAGNVGAIMRLGACMGIAVDLIEPLGFGWDDKRVRRTAMDYIDHVEVVRHSSFASFRSRTPGRLILFSTKGANSPYDFAFLEDDILLFGKESGGVPDDVAAQCDGRLRIPIRTEVRSFNLATSAALGLGEALRQTRQLPD